MTALHVPTALQLPSLRALRVRTHTYLTSLLRPDPTRAHRQATLDRTLEAEAHHARVQRALLGGPR
ncbi:hypothetical protein [Deinococcus sedimenti]|uniref:Uncharacterized protein n=1 Tax=Deinococcus sedimenti TaxID=1867090 RepID=A0ABQ2S6G7_9DEIO|nr:hypothetical protein [Deinococcus sedimenti]GGS00009.1 hypothetical protein GCM10008960_28330 [Deinococcus sedimenti]